MSANINTYLKREVARLTEENRLLKEENLSLRQYIDSLNALMEALDDLSPDAEIMPLLDRILYNGLMVVNATEGSLLALDDETGELEFVLAQGTVGREKLIGQRLPPGKGIAGWVAKNNKPTIVNNVQADYRFYSAIDDRIHFQTNSVLAAPIAGGGRVLGVLEMVNKHDGKPFTATDQTLLTILCRFAGEILNFKVKQDEGQAASS